MINKKILDLFDGCVSPSVTFIHGTFVFNGTDICAGSNYQASFDGEHIIFFNADTEENVGTCNLTDICKIVVSYDYTSEDWMLCDKNGDIIFKAKR